MGDRQIIRASLLFIVVGSIVAGVLYDRLNNIVVSGTSASEEAIVTPSVGDPARLDGAWFCAMGSSLPGGFADHFIHISNLSNEAAVANVDILTGAGPGPTVRIEMAPLSTQTVALSSIAEAEFAGAVVEIIGGTGVVGHTVETEQGSAEGSCSTHVSNSWHFASGRTTRDSRQYLALMNPFPEDVVYNVEFYRAAGRPRRPADLQGGVIPASSVQIIEVDSFVAREEAVATVVTTVRGRLVVERLQTLDGVLGPQGAALQLGVVAPAQSWVLAAGRVHDGGDDKIIVFNPATEESATVDIELWPLNPTDRSLYGLVSIPRELLPGRFEVIDLGIEADRFGLRLPYELGVSVRSSNDVPVVAERWHLAVEVDTSLIGAGGSGVASTEEGEGEVTTAEGETDPVTGTDPAAGTDPGEGGPLETGADEATDPLAGGELDVPGILGGQVSEFGQATASTGIATSRGTEVDSNRWVLPWVPVPTAESTVVVATSTQDVAVEVMALINGELQGPFRGSIVAGGRTIIPVPVTTVGAPLIVSSDGRISVEAQVVDSDGRLTVLPGVPTVQ